MPFLEENIPDILGGFDSLRTGFAVFDADDVLIYHNEQFQYVYLSFQMLDGLLGRRFEDLLRLMLENGEIAGKQALDDPEDWIAWRLENHRSERNRIELRLTDGRWIEVKERRTPSGGVIGQWADITDAKRSANRLEDAIKCSADGFAIWDQAGRLNVYNEIFAERFNIEPSRDPASYTLRPFWSDLANSGTVVFEGEAEAWAKERLHAHRAGENECVLHFADDTFLLLRERATRDGGVTMALADVTELKHKERELRYRGQSLQAALDEIDLAKTALEEQAKQMVHLAEDLDEAKTRADKERKQAEVLQIEAMAHKEHEEAILRTMGDGLVIANARGEIEKINLAGEKIFGISSDEAQGTKINRFMRDENAQEHDKSLINYNLNKESKIVEHPAVVVGKRENGEEFPLEIHVTRAESKLGPFFVASLRDVTRRKAMEEELIRLANTDTLTGAANRRAFLDALKVEIERALRYDHPICVMVCDLDHFKKINDTYGHGVGDEVLRGFVATTQSQLRESDLLSRFGGEEFAVMLPETGLEAARKIAQRLCDAVAETTYSALGEEVRMTVSIGLTNIQAGRESISAALNRADAALYDAKQEGRNRVVLA